MRTRGRLELIGVKEEGAGGGARDTSPKFRPICHPSEGLRKYLKSWPGPPRGHALRLIVPSSLVTVTLLNASNIVFFSARGGQRRTGGREEEAGEEGRK